MNSIMRSYFDSKKFGFITPLVGKPGTTPDVNFHGSAIRKRGRASPGLPRGAEVRFDVVRGERGLQAANIELVRVRLSSRESQNEACGADKPFAV